MEEKTMILIDGHNLLFRMFYGIPSSIKNSRGIDIRGLIGFIGSIKRLYVEFNPDSIIVFFDSETSRFTNEQIDNDYKANRKDYSNVDEENNPFSQLPLIKKALDYLNIFNMEIQQNEVDDYIASVVNDKRYKNTTFIIVSTDSDFIQLINSNTYLYVQRGKNSVLYNETLIKNKYNILPHQYIEYKSLIGDNCDNIKGIKGIGKVTATNILQYGDIESFIKFGTNERIKKTLIESMETIIRNIKLITLSVDLDTDDLTKFSFNNNFINLKVGEIIKCIDEK